MHSKLERCRNIDDLRTLARRRLPGPMFHYIDGGADDEWTLRRNVDAFDSRMLVPRCLINVDSVELSTHFLGARTALPVMLAPTGMTRLFHHEGERAVARAAASAGVYYGLSTLSTVSIEEVGAATNGPKCFQIYAFRDRGLTRELVERARSAGFRSLCLTVDMVTAGNRERDLRSGMTLPPQLSLKSLLDVLRHSHWLWHFLTGEPINMANVAGRITEASSSVSTLAQYINNQFDPTLTWRDVEWIIDCWCGPFAVKGILSAADARRCRDIGATAVMVSNHGGRQLDGAPATFEMLPRIADAVGGDLEVILDGGIRRGSHVVKALAAGASACMIGRPYLYGVSAGGQAGVARVLALLTAEIVRTMKLIGARTPAEINQQAFEDGLESHESSQATAAVIPPHSAQSIEQIHRDRIAL